MPKTSLLAAVTHELISNQQFDDWADLTEAVKCMCASLKIPYDAGTITAAVRLVERTRPVFRERPRPRNPRHVERPDTVDPIGKDEAAQIIARLQAMIDHAKTA
jgi:hypothetical protein